ncbi:MAG TPA: hypothetical protein VH164_16310 [Ktedonobacteraceae bacterium]|jgi:hypothetical protein|nr:hypothetical protein [Ktedonobacteraceae bacterium]
MQAARDYAALMGQHVTLLLGVVAEHDSPMAQELLDELLAKVMTLPDMPLLPNAIAGDCLVAPPERAGVHVEVMWISL